MLDGKIIAITRSKDDASEFISLAEESKATPIPLPTIELVSKGEVDNNYLVVEVLGKDGMAIGSMEYSKSIDIQEVEGTMGVVVKGANGKEEQLN